MIVGGIPMLFSGADSGSGLTYAQEVLADTPFRYWRFLETSGTTAVGAVAGNGTYSGGFTLNQAGFVAGGKSVNFDATATPGGKMASTSSQNLTTGFALECFFNASATGQDTQPNLISKKTLYADDAVNFAVGVVWDAINSQILFQLSKGNDYALDLNLASAVLAPSTDYHCVCNYRQNGLCEIYINKVLSASATINFTVSSGSALWTVATPNEVGGGVGLGSFNGRVGEVAIYSAALSAARIEAHYNARNT